MTMPADKAGLRIGWVAQKALLSAFALMLAFLLVEVLFRVFPGFFAFMPPPEDFMPHVFTTDPAITWTLMPNAHATHTHLRGDFKVRVTTDAQGFRITERRPGKPRVLILGDSFTFGFGVEDDETYPACLSRLLPEADIINAGYTCGMSPDTYYVYLKTHIDTIKPALVVVQFLAGNDFSDIAANQWQPAGQTLPDRIVTSYRAGHNGRISFTRSGRLARWAPVIRRHSRFGAWVLDRVWSAINPSRGVTDCTYRNPETVAKIARLARAMKDLCDAKQVRFLWVFIPLTYDAGAKAMYGEIEEQLRQALVARDVPFAEATALYAFPRDKLHFAHDGHFSATGNRLFAEQLMPVVRKNLE